MMAWKLAWKNLKGAGIRTLLNVVVLSFSYVVIIWHYGLLDGWNRQARRDSIQWEMGGGQIWHPDYDPYDPFVLTDSHGVPPAPLARAAARGSLAPQLLATASIYPQGRLQSAMLRGIDPARNVLAVPAHLLADHPADIPVLVGRSMARDLRLSEGDRFTIRWRDAHGAFDAAEAEVAGVFKTTVPSIDRGQLWMPLDRLQAMLELEGHATLLVAHPDAGKAMRDSAASTDWVFRDLDYLLSDMNEIIRSKSIGGSFLYVLLLGLAMLAIFDTQVLSVFRRQKEIGTLVAMGMTRSQVVRLFTVEGALYGVLAALAAAVWGIPLLSMQAVHGIGVPMSEDMGLAVAERIFPVYSAGLITATALIVMVTTTLVSYIPARKIARMKPTEAIRGKMQ